jgi:hypothetical protein
MKIGSVCLIGDFNNEGPLRYVQCVLLEDNVKHSQLVNVSMYLLHEVTSCTTWDSLNTITEEITIRSNIQVNAAIYMTN